MVIFTAIICIPHSTNDAYSRHLTGQCFNLLSSNAKHFSMDVLDIILSRDEHSNAPVTENVYADVFFFLAPSLDEDKEQGLRSQLC